MLNSGQMVDVLLQKNYFFQKEEKENEKEERCNFMKQVAWTTGIILSHIEEGWFASCDWRCGVSHHPGDMEGCISTRYCNESLAEAIDYVLACMAHMNVKRADELEVLKDMGFALYYKKEAGEEISEEIKQEMKNEAQQRGWLAYEEYN